MDQLSIDLALKIVKIAEEAGRAILQVYESADLGITYKDDKSPLTEADKRSHAIIGEALAELTPDIPVLSEEGKDIPYEQRKNWQRFYLVDPLDGTKEFIKRNGEFTVNIAIIDRGRPALGVIHIPAQGVSYFAAEDAGAYRKAMDGSKTRIETTGAIATDELIVTASRSHGADELERFLEHLSVRSRVSAGSALKFCMIAEGRADIYPRFGPTWEWDTAAGHAIVLEAGGRVVDTGGTDELQYNKPVIKHKGFIAAPTVLISSLFG